MSAFSDAISKRYAARETETDAFGRVIEVRRLRPGATLRVRTVVGSEVPAIETEALIAASVCSVTEPGGKPIVWSPLRNQVELTDRLDVLEREGMEAAVAAYRRIMDAAEPSGAVKEEATGSVTLGEAAPDLIDAAERLEGAAQSLVGPAAGEAPAQ